MLFAFETDLKEMSNSWQRWSGVSQPAKGK